MEFRQIPEDIGKVKDRCGVVHIQLRDGLGRLGISLTSEELGVEGHHQLSLNERREGAAEWTSLCDAFVLFEGAVNAAVASNPASVGVGV